MGASVSKNITKVTTEAIARVSNNIVSQTKLSTDQTQIISVTDVDGDVVISGNKFTQKANINMKSLMNALIQEDIQQALTMEIAQAAKSIVSGLNLFQFADAKNDIDMLLKASTEIVNAISQSCAANMSENQAIVVTRVKGNVYIQNNLMEQFADIFGSCVQEAVSKNTILQTLQDKIDQSASAKAEGLDLWQIIILVAIVLGIPFVSIIGGVSVVGRYLFPLSILAGAGCLTLYFNWVDETVFSHAFSPLIRFMTGCDYQPLSATVTSFPTASMAAAACAANKSCAAFDWQGASIDAAGNHTSFSPPQTTFYSRVSQSCENAIKTSPDHSKVFRIPVFVKGNGPPTKPKGDVYLDLGTANYYFFDFNIGQWVKQGSFAHSDFTSRNTVNWGTIAPTPTTQGVPGSVYVLYSATNPIYFHVYVKNPDAWKLYTPPLKGPGLIPDTPININVSGFTAIAYKQWLLYLGAALLIVGVLGSVVSFSSSKSRNESPSRNESVSSSSAA
ncbi:lipid membrane protein [Chloriridovirus anopheles1]|uniref:Lipid membrane protein n=1 Tax=Chloriridovirus anopheles1 TaxID=1465751 RepID=W8QE45_9VIRU|nr:lipid membrane protein [Anopheles minimus iridovirus]AHL67565.1 lipid membrane protein [Anopheles minimus iridovirus]